MAYFSIYSLWFVPTVKKEKFQVAVNFKDKNGTFVPLRTFTVLLVNDNMLINDVNGKISTIINGPSRWWSITLLTARSVKKMLTVK